MPAAPTVDAAALEDLLAPSDALEAGFCKAPLAQVEARVDALLGKMTLEEKVAQLHGLQLSPLEDLYHTPDNARLGIPGLRMVDGPRGVRAGTATAFPVPVARGASWNTELEHAVGAAIGAEARAKGANVLLAPTMNVLRHPRWGRAQETYGEDPLHIGSLASAFIEGAQQQLIASAKHFALNSIEDTRFDVNVEVDERSLREVYLPHFRMAVREAHVASVMSAYNSVNGFHASENQHLLRDILKGEWGFAGFVESDWVFGTRDTLGAALGGLDIEMPAARHYGSALRDAVEQGQLPEAVVDEAVRRVLRVKDCFDLREGALPSRPPPGDLASLSSGQHPAHAELALQAARQGTVLLKNAAWRDQIPALPLDPGSDGDLVVLGPLSNLENIGDLGSSAVTPHHVVTLLQGLRARSDGLQVVHISDTTLSEQQRSQVRAATAAVVAVGLSGAQEGEGLIASGDRSDLALPAGQDALVAEVAALQPRTIVVLEGGGALQVEAWVAQVPAVLMAWYPGQEGGTALAELIFGSTNPSGKLPVSFPRSGLDLPEFDNQSLQVRYGRFHGYQHLDRSGIEPRFPFGHGLGYSAFAYSDLQLSEARLAPDDTLELSFDLKNLGPYDGTEVVQVYLQTEGSALPRPALALLAFARISLSSSEQRKVSLQLPMARLASYDTGAERWAVEALRYTLHVAASSRDLRLAASFEVSPTGN